ncbi:hypothetical protein [Paenibacillus sp. Y412MC10]|uniref:hypothetical protein n=1 Tax=Geobacillus sp. (strain Y412MC10) TaxID=481743 RepID=UPI0016433C21|nr:hypothetical protein [Paenibacillus sp. Y412MC10]
MHPKKDNRKYLEEGGDQNELKQEDFHKDMAWIKGGEPYQTVERLFAENKNVYCILCGIPVYCDVDLPNV